MAAMVPYQHVIEYSWVSFHLNISNRPINLMLCITIYINDQNNLGKHFIDRIWNDIILDDSWIYKKCFTQLNFPFIMTL